MEKIKNINNKKKKTLQIINKIRLYLHNKILFRRKKQALNLLNKKKAAYVRLKKSKTLKNYKYIYLHFKEIDTLEQMKLRNFFKKNKFVLFLKKLKFFLKKQLIHFVVKRLLVYKNLNHFNLKLYSQLFMYTLKYLVSIFKKYKK